MAIDLLIQIYSNQANELMDIDEVTKLVKEFCKTMKLINNNYLKTKILNFLLNLIMINNNILSINQDIVMQNIISPENKTFIIEIY